MRKKRFREKRFSAYLLRLQERVIWRRETGERR